MNDPSANNQNDPLLELFADRQPLDKAALASLLKPYIQLYSDPPEVVPTPIWTKLNLTRKVLTYMLGLKALRLTGKIPEEEERKTPAWLAEHTGINPNSIRPTLSKLRDERVVKMDKEQGNYWVADNALLRVKVLLEGEQGE